MDVDSRSEYPLNLLSNFAEHHFVIDGIQCNSMEGFLSSLKFKDVNVQNEVCLLVGYKAKQRGLPEKWFETQILYWQGVEYKRDSQEYQDLLDRAYFELSKVKKFREVLLSTGDENITHNVGKTKIEETILTRREFCSRLKDIRDRYNDEETDKKYKSIF